MNAANLRYIWKKQILSDIINHAFFLLIVATKGDISKDIHRPFYLVSQDRGVIADQMTNHVLNSTNGKSRNLKLLYKPLGKRH